ncbi:hypothetical protein CBR_g52388 [Chara braunii]|uniref:DUF4283 domain-containing protein n=1 Tax=Chara braunii TaxID=69332 RepID=A0A388MAB3_CHABU|nr:hypothetical protein CBR_g52388 [Chara braunii]|eukprot:GBG91433.1 hypothetical protein CBR_g52388 [Chara braunii]
MANPGGSGEALPNPHAIPSDWDRVRNSVERCYDEGVCPQEGNLGTVVEDEEGRRFVVNEEVNKVKDQWLRKRSVMVVFQGGARNLSRAVKEDLIRAYEDGWTARKLFQPEARRGRVKFEGQNVASYVAKSKDIATWLIKQKEMKIKLDDNKDYIVTFKPRLSKKEMQDHRILEAESKFWIMALRVPLDAYYFLGSAVVGLFGEITEMHPLEYDRDRPKLMNVKIDMPASSRSKIDDVLVIQSPEGERWKVDIVTPYTDWCHRCRWYFHTEDRCPRNIQTEEGRNSNGERQWGHKERYRQHLESQGGGMQGVTRENAGNHASQQPSREGQGRMGEASRQEGTGRRTNLGRTSGSRGPALRGPSQVLGGEAREATGDGRDTHWSERVYKGSRNQQEEELRHTQFQVEETYSRPQRWGEAQKMEQGRTFTHPWSMREEWTQSNVQGLVNEAGPSGTP